MAMPPQLARWQKTKPRKYKSTKLIAETLPRFDINELTRAIPRRYGIVRTQQFMSSTHPPVVGLRLTCETIEVFHKSGNTQKFKLKWIKTGFGYLRPAIRCDKCGKPYRILYNHYDDLACRSCRPTIYLCQRLDKRTRPVLKAHRLQVFLEFKNNINKRTQERLLRKHSEKAMRPQHNYRLGTPRLWV